MLVSFVAEHYPDFLKTYCSYEAGILRADAARYMLLHHFGGVYADLDCECVASFAPIMAEDRVVLCCEPTLHTYGQAQFRGLPYLLFNGTMVSPPGHAFWPHLMSYLPNLAQAKDVLDATGPYVLTSAQLSFADQGSLIIHPSSLFAPFDRDGREEKAEGNESTKALSVHHWAGTWYSDWRRSKLWEEVRRRFYQGKYLLTRSRQLDTEAARRAVDPAVLQRAAPGEANIAVLVPLRDAADHIAPFLAAMEAIDYPKERIKLVFCEGDSSDGSWERLRTAVAPLESSYRGIVLLQKHLGTRLDHSKRAKPKLQRSRRSGIAKVRNHLIEHGLDANDDWALWIDIDVWQFPADIVTTLIRSGHRIVTPNCVKTSGGRSFDLNSFVTTRPDRDFRYYRAMRDGLYQPKPDFIGRLYLSDVRHLEKVELHSVGGTMLLVDASLHRGGLRFPELPYRNLIETEGFGALARDLSVIPVGLPRVEILHVPW
jgi:GT2 family glycosyltransferase